jgi:hypothetical protein
MMIRNLNLPLRGFGAPASHARVELAELNPGDRVKRAGAVFGTFLVVAAIGLPIPLVHFVLVPGALLLGVVLGLNRLRQREIFRQVAGRCPFCREDQSFSVMGTFRLPKRLHCGRCQRELELTT